MAEAKKQEEGMSFMGAAIIGFISFLSLIDLFGPQAIGPILTESFGVSPSTMGFAINASTMGMAIAGLGVALVSRSLDRRKWIWVCLSLLTIPTIALAYADTIEVFTALRITQGLLMAVAFTLTMAYLSENCTASKAVTAMAAYITGNVASNLLGRLMSASIVEFISVEAVFYVLAALNVVGAILAMKYIGLSDKHIKKPEIPEDKKPHFACPIEAGRVCGVWYQHLANPRLVSSFVIGFIILFVFIGAYTYINYVLSSDKFGLDAATLGLVYFVFIPSVFTTPIAGKFARKMGVRLTYWLSSIVSVVGLMCLLFPQLPVVLFGLAILAVGLFFAQASITGFVGQAATTERAAASGLYLSSYYFGGLCGAIVLGKVFEIYGWGASVWLMVGLLVLSCVLAVSLNLKKMTKPMKA